jgi:hypothetical protein
MEKRGFEICVFERFDIKFVRDLDFKWDLNLDLLMFISSRFSIEF